MMDSISGRFRFPLRHFLLFLLLPFCNLFNNSQSAKLLISFSHRICICFSSELRFTHNIILLRFIRSIARGFYFIITLRPRTQFEIPFIFLNFYSNCYVIIVPQVCAVLSFPTTLSLLLSTYTAFSFDDERNYYFRRRRKKALKYSVYIKL